MSEETRRNAESFAANEALWNAWTAVHATAPFYDLDGLSAVNSR